MRSKARYRDREPNNLLVNDAENMKFTRSLGAAFAVLPNLCPPGFVPQFYPSIVKLMTLFSALAQALVPSKYPLVMPREHSEKIALFRSSIKEGASPDVRS